MRSQLNEVKKLQKIAGIKEESKPPIDIKAIKVGSILNFEDGEAWIVTKREHDGVLAKPHNKNTKEKYVSIEIYMPFDELEAELASVTNNNSRT